MNYLSLGYSCSCHIIVYKLEAGPSKHAGSESEAFWLRPVMAITAIVQSESGRIIYNYAGSDFPHPTRFRSSKEGPDRIV